MTATMDLCTCQKGHVVFWQRTESGALVCPECLTPHPDETVARHLELLHGERGIESDEYRHAVLSTVAQQWRELRGQDVPVTSTCPCGRRMETARMFRCYHCDIRWCPGCARRHFGPRLPR